MFLENTKKVIKILDDKFRHVLYFSTKQECNQITAEIVGDGVDIIAYGECRTMDIKTAKAVLPNSKYIHNLVTGAMEDTFHCFCCENLGVEQFVGHKTPLNSWDCLMTSLGNPEYCVITQELISTDERSSV
jgi:hypothetical protein